jgi:hypothetical protein
MSTAIRALADETLPPQSHGLESLFQNPATAELTRLKLHELQGIWSILMSAATVLKEPLEIEV